MKTGAPECDGTGGEGELRLQEVRQHDKFSFLGLAMDRYYLVFAPKPFTYA
jgi:hypothetical protein